MDLTNNFILKTDSYKLTHHKQYPKGTTKIVSYLESRGGKYPKSLFFGLQYFLEQLEGQVVTAIDVEQADAFCKLHFGADYFNKSGWEYIVKRHGGVLPIKIKAIKEGTLVPTSNVLMTIENTDPNCFWLTNVLETMLMRIWHPITIATNGFYAKKIIAENLNATANNLDGIQFKLHDFAFRGVSSEDSAGIGGMAHLVNFMGTDNLASITFANKYYNDTEELKMFGYSVPASEHSVACTFGDKREEEYFLNMLDKFPTGIVSIVSDTYNVFNFVKNMSKNHKEKILSRDGTVVFRPDSGDPIEVNMKLIDILWSIFGGEYTENGYKLLNSHVRLIQGDGIVFDLEESTIEQIYAAARARGYSADNWVFGSGGGLLQKFDRDTMKFAIKACYGEKELVGAHGKINVGFSISKDPVTSTGKRSKGGMLKLHPHAGSFTTISSDEETKEQFAGYIDAMDLVFEDGVVKRYQSFEEIQDLSSQYLKLEMEEIMLV